jgi:enediyne biosynthesis protein E4
LLRNDQKLGHNWVRLNLRGTENNRDAIGATVNLRVGNETLSRQVMPTRGYLSQSERTLTFGLGTASQIDAIEIVWPGGRIQSVAPGDVALNTLSLIQEPAREALAHTR